MKSLNCDGKDVSDSAGLIGEVWCLRGQEVIKITTVASSLLFLSDDSDL